jgi:large conductance mechanosensitive channel
MKTVPGFKNFLMQGNVIVAAIGLSIALAYRAYEARLGNTVFGPQAPTQTCPQCQSSDLPVKATRCKYCASELTPASEGPAA